MADTTAEPANRNVVCRSEWIETPRLKRACDGDRFYCQGVRFSYQSHHYIEGHCLNCDRCQLPLGKRDHPCKCISRGRAIVIKLRKQEV